MAFNAIDPTTPAGTDKIKFGDDRIREFKAQEIANWQEISNYPASTKPALRTAVWTTATRPSGDELVDRVTGYNTDFGCDEYYDLDSTSWKAMGMPSWSVSARPSSPLTGMYGYNTDLAVIERYSGSAWVRVSGDFRGKIDMWSGAVDAIPAGWVLSDGVERTHPEGGKYTPPNLRDKFIAGAGTSYAVGATGGENTVTLTVDTMPLHGHPTYISLQDEAGGDPTGGCILNVEDSHVYGAYTGSPGATPGRQVGGSGGGQAHENRPPYYALCYLYKI